MPGFSDEPASRLHPLDATGTILPPDATSHNLSLLAEAPPPGKPSPLERTLALMLLQTTDQDHIHTLFGELDRNPNGKVNGEIGTSNLQSYLRQYAMHQQQHDLSGLYNPNNRSVVEYMLAHWNDPDVAALRGKTSEFISASSISTALGIPQDKLYQSFYVQHETAFQPAQTPMPPHQPHETPPPGRSPHKQTPPPRHEPPAPTVPPVHGGYLHGVNLAGAEFAPGALPGKSGADYTFPTAQELDYYKQKGMNLIRLPFLWERMQPGLLNGGTDRSFDPLYAKQLNAFLTQADKRGMHVILDAHDYGRYNNQVIGGSNITNDDFKQFWMQMAKTFGAHKSVYGWDLSNEPNSEDNKTWHNAAQAAIDGIRSTGDKHAVIVEGNQWAGAQSWAQNNSDLMMNDPANNVIYEAHSYWDTDHSGTYSGGDEGSYQQAVASARNQGILGPNEDPTDLAVNQVKPYLDWLKKNHLRGFIGEFGVPSNNADWIKVQDKFLRYMKQNDIPVTAWGGGPWWGTDYVMHLENGKKGPESTSAPPPPSLQDMQQAES